MIAFILILLACLARAQEIELTTTDVQAYARVKNCIDFYTCLKYDETLHIHQGHYRWNAKFTSPVSSILKAFDECRVGAVDFELSVKDQDGSVITDFQILRLPLSPEIQRHLLPMELYQRTFEGLKRKENPIEVLLRNGQPEMALKSTVFEIEYGLGEYQLEVKPILRANVLATTHHLKKMITYDLEKWDGSLCRFYQVMRHEVQHVRNIRRQRECISHHFTTGNHNERATYLNDLVFIKTYCPQEVALYQNVEGMLLKMYQNKEFQTCDGEGAGTAAPRVAKSLKQIRQPYPGLRRTFSKNFKVAPQKRKGLIPSNKNGLH
jgi:hypothetical protein